MTEQVSTTDTPAAMVGIDWADQEHAVCLQQLGSGRPEASTLKQTPEAIDEWATALRKRFGGRRVAVCLEQSKGALIYALLKYDFFILYPINPAKLAYYRQAVGLRTRFSNPLRAQLKCYFPQALEVLSEDLGTAMACDFLERWPSLAELKRARTKTIHDFYHAHSCRGRELIDRRLEKIRQAKPLTNDMAIIEAGVTHVRMLVGLLRQLIQPIADYDERIEQLMDVHDDARIFSSFPGAGAAMAPRLLAAFGTDRDAIPSAEAIQTYSGIAPVTKRSGKSCIVHRRWACPKFVRQTFHEFAGHSIGFSDWARAYYQQQRQRGKKHHAAVRALAFKWIRILYRCWKTRTPYNKGAYLKALRDKQSPLAGSL